MQKTLFVFVGALALAAAQRPGIAGNAVSQVVTLLDNLQLKAQEDLHAEDVQFATFATWSNVTITQKTAELAEENQQIKDTNDNINSLQAKMDKLNQDITDLTNDILRYTNDLNQATQARATSHEEFLAHYKDYNESLDALASATATVKAKAVDKSQVAAGALLQVSALLELESLRNPSHMNKDALASFRQLLEPEALTFLQVDSEVMDEPVVKGYENHMEPILEMFGNLTAKFTQEVFDLKAAETQKEHEFDLLKADMQNQINTASATKDSKNGALAAATADQASAKQTLVDITNERDATSQYLKDTTTTYQIKTSDYKTRHKLRVDELNAMKQALTILNSDDVTGSAGRNTAALLQVRRERRHVLYKATSLIQLRGAKQVPLKLRLMEFLQQQGQSIGSRVLMALAAHVSDDPLAQVKTMIQGVITQLESEHRGEADHVNWCAGELQTNLNNRIEKSNSVDALTAEIDGLNANVNTLVQTIAEQASEISTLQIQIANATQIRANEKAENLASLNDANNGQMALEKAINIISNFYNRAAKATVLLQVKEDPPPIFSDAYQGNQAGAQGNTGLISVLQGLLADFTQLASDTEQEEQTALTEFRQFQRDSNTQLASLQQSKEDNEFDRSQTSQLIISKTADLNAAKNDLSAATAYYNKLNSSCVNDQLDKQKKRDDEIDSLKKALDFLNETADLFADLNVTTPTPQLL